MEGLLDASSSMQCLSHKRKALDLFMPEHPNFESDVEDPRFLK
jgi:hypothetical protein